MYKIKNINYADAGKVLKHNGILSFLTDSDIFEELVLQDSPIVVTNNLVTYGLIFFKNIHSNNYADWKSYLIKRRYSNDDQIAIILNKDNSLEDTLRFNKMQEWREWAGLAASKILEKL